MVQFNIQATLPEAKLSSDAAKTLDVEGATLSLTLKGFDETIEAVYA